MTAPVEFEPGRHAGINAAGMILAERHASADVEGGVASLKPSAFEPFVRETADAIYDRLLSTVQDYLIENAQWNIGTRISSLEAENQRLRTRCSELIGQVSDAQDCLRPFAHAARMFRPDDADTMRPAVCSAKDFRKALALYDALIRGDSQ